MLTSTSAPRQGRRSPVRAQSQPYSIPSNRHLIITTPSRVLSWDENGLRSCFESGSEGILAAKEAKDGSGVLAIADSQVVLLHDCRRGLERSYRLKGTDGQIRLLHFTQAPVSSLFFTTTLQSSVQHYSLPAQRLLDPPSLMHPSPPTVLATSKSSHLLLSASANPPAVFLQNLLLGTAPLLVQPAASAHVVVVSAFHPEREAIFLLGFADSTIAGYDALRLTRDGGKMSDPSIQKSGQSGEISHLKHLHTSTTRGAKDPAGIFNDAVLGGYDSGSNTVCVGSRGAAITAAAFMPGHKTRAVTVGADGRCRLVDFESGGKILRTWHVRGPATSLSILSLKSNPGLVFTTKGPSGPKKRLRDGRNTTNMRKPTITDNVLAVGRADGKVLLFDSVGLLLAEQVVDQSAGRVIDVDWMEGPAPKPIHSRGSETAPLVEDTTIDLPALIAASAGSRGSKSDRQSRRESIQSNSKSSSLASHSGLDRPTKHGPGLSPGSARPAHPVSRSNDGSVAMSGALPDESGTVHRTPVSGLIHRDLPAVPAATTSYMDLFSPVKPIAQSPERRLTLRPRPRIFSSTFRNTVLSPTVGSPKRSLSSPSRNLDLFPSECTSGATSGVSSSGDSLSFPDDSSSQDLRPPVPPKSPGRAATLSVHHFAKPIPKKGKGRRVSYRRMPGSFVDSSSSLATNSTSCSSISNGKILADLRRVDNDGQKSRKGSLAFFAPYMQPKAAPASNLKDCSAQKRAMKGHKKEYKGEVVSQAQKHDSADELEDEWEDDIWLTSDTEAVHSTRPARQRRSKRHFTSHRGLSLHSPDRRHHSDNSVSPSSTTATATASSSSSSASSTSHSTIRPSSSSPSPSRSTLDPISTSTRSSRTTSSTADHSTSTAHQVDNNDDDDDDDGMVTAASHRSPLASDGKFVPPSPIVRSLFPRISSKSQGVSRQRKAAGSPSRDIARDRRALGELQHNAVVLAGPPKVYAPDEAHSQWGSVPDSGATVEMQPPSPPSRRPSQYLSQPLPQTHPHPRTRKQQTSSPPQRPHPRPTISHYVSPKPGPAPVPVPVYADTYHTFRPQEQNGLVVHEETRTYACPCPCCPALRDEVRTLRAEMERLRLEVGVVRRGWSAGGRR